MRTLFAMEGWHVWCPSIVQWGGRWWLFHSRWPTRLGFNSWVSHSTTAVAVADRPDGPFTDAGEILPGSGAGWDAHVTHNPCAFVHGDRLWLAYMGNHGTAPRAGAASSEEWWVHRNNQRIGFAWAMDPLGPWHRASSPVVGIADVPWPAIMASNPAVAVGPDGGVRMIYKSVGTGPMPFGGEVRHVVAEAPGPAGPWTHLPAPVLTAPGVQFAAEDPYLWHAADGWHLLAKDMRGTFTDAGTSIAHFVSSDGRDWRPAPTVLVGGLVQDGLTYERLERPSFIDDRLLVCAALRDDRTTIVAKPWSPP